VLEVPAKLAARVRVLSVGHGRKSDADDAVSVAVAARHAPQLRQVTSEDQATVLHLLTKRREDLVAAHTGTAPLEASSGQVIRHRLSRAGGPQAQPCPVHDGDRAGPPAQRRAELLPLRCLKRRLSDAVYRCLVIDQQGKAEAAPA
jgi:hypothetical protein